MKSEEDSHLKTQENNDGLLHGTDILKYLVVPWANSERGVCADSYRRWSNNWEIHSNIVDNRIFLYN